MNIECNIRSAQKSYVPFIVLELERKVLGRIVFDIGHVTRLWSPGLFGSTCLQVVLKNPSELS